MGIAPPPPDEAARLAVLASCNILDTPPEDDWDDLAHVAAEVCDAPMAIVSLVADDRQWFKARVGFLGTEVPRRISFCAHALVQDAPLIVTDTHGDARFADNPLVLGAPNIRFYAGVPLKVDEGSAIGTLCVMDTVPRTLNEAQLASLRALARQIIRQLRLRRDLRDARGNAPTGRMMLEAGDVVSGKWIVERLLGQGFVGAVYAAHDGEGHRAAIKVLLPGWKSAGMVVERFVREARVLMQLRGPHSARLLDVGNLDESRGSLPFLAMEYLEGDDLERVLQRQGVIPWKQAALWIADAADGVAEAHRLGIVHRDLKPSNVFLAQTPEGPTVKVLDFGIAKVDRTTEASSLTREGSPIGTMHYMSPEHWTNPLLVEARSDVWSMGVMLYELVTGKQPFQAETEMGICTEVLTRKPLPLRASVTVPPVLEAIVRRCLNKAPAQRFPSLEALRDTLRAVVAA